MFGSKNIVIIWVSAKQLIVMGGKLAGAQSVPFPENVVSNLEVVDHDALYALIKTWTSAHPIQDGEIVWVFGPDLFFEHIMQDTERAEWDTVVVRFLDLLPFEEVESRVYTTTKGTKVVAINKDLYEALVRGFALQGYTTRAEIAASELGPLSQAPTLTKDVYSYVMKNLDTLSKNRLTGDSAPVDHVSLPTDQPAKKKSTLPLLIGVFALLLGVLGFMILRMNK
jgi:hypothetical protein